MARRKLPPIEQMSSVFYEWLNWMVLYEDHRPATVDRRSRAVRKLLSYTDIPPGEFGPESFDQALLMDTVMEMRTDVDIATIRRSIQTLEAFYDFCLEDRLISQKPNFERIKLLLHKRTPDGPYELSSLDEQMPPSFQEWLQWMNRYEGRSQKNIRSRSSEVCRLLSYAEIPPGEFEPDSFDQVLLEDTVREMKMKGKVAVATIRRSLKLLEAFYDFCLADRLITDKPNFSKIEGRLPQSPKAPRQPSTPHWNGDSYDPDELYQLFGAAASTSCAGSSQIRWPARDFAIVGFLGVVGLRPGELVDAQVSWINEGTGWGSFDSSEPTLFLNVQTRPGRLNIPLSPELVRTHRKWMDERCELLGTPLPNEPLFVSSYGEGLTTRRLREILRVLNSEAGLRDRPPSTLRRTVQRMHVEAGLSRAEIQLLMGYRRPPR